MFKVPDELPDSVLGFVNCAMGTVTEGLMQARCKEGDYVVVQGAGGLGLNAVAAAKDMGAHRVIVLDRLENRLELAREFGADHTINIEQEWTTPEMRIQRVKELTDGRGADVVMELVGRSALMQEGIEYLGPGGTFVEIGNIVPGTPIPIDPSSILFGAQADHRLDHVQAQPAADDAGDAGQEAGQAALRQDRLAHLPAGEDQRRVRAGGVAGPPDLNHPLNAGDVAGKRKRTE